MIADDGLIIGRGAEPTSIANPEFFIPVSTFLSQQPNNTLLVDPLLKFSNIANGSSKTLLDYCQDHKITHIIGIRQYSTSFVEIARVIKTNAELVADKINQILAQETVAKVRNNPKGVLIELMQKYKLSTSVIGNVKVKEQALRRAAMTVGAKNDISILVASGININAQDENPLKRNTALHVALINKNFENARFLISLGAKIDIANADGVTANDLIQKLNPGTI